LLITAALRRIPVFGLVISGLLFSQQQPVTSSSSPQANPPAAEQPANQSAPPAAAHEPTQPNATQPQVNESRPQSTATGKSPQDQKKQAWQILETAATGDKTSDRAISVRVLGLVPNDAKARKLAENALGDNKPEVRAAAAAALGDMMSRSSIPKLKKAIDDDDPLVVLAAAHSLNQMHDASAYEVYYAVLTNQRKVNRGLIASQTAILKDPKKMAQLGFEEGIGFIPFAGIGWGAVKAIAKDDTSPVRAAAARVLATDPDPATTRALSEAAGDKSWLVRAAALEALAKRGDPLALDTVELYMGDEKAAVEYTAAAAVLRLMTIKEAGPAPKGKKKKQS
jgi:HEAT repeat protein